MDISPDSALEEAYRMALEILLKLQPNTDGTLKVLTAYKDIVTHDEELITRKITIPSMTVAPPTWETCG